MNSNSGSQRQRRCREESYQTCRADSWKVMTQTKHVDMWEMGSAFTSCKQELNKNFNNYSRQDSYRAGTAHFWALSLL